LICFRVDELNFLSSAQTAEIPLLDLSRSRLQDLEAPISRQCCGRLDEKQNGQLDVDAASHLSDP